MDFNRIRTLIRKGRLNKAESAELERVLNRSAALYQAAKTFVDSDGFQGICDEEVLLEQAVHNFTN